MANFVSTTTSGYSDPIKAQSIKALEARQKEMQAQIAAAQAGGITPENTQTPIQGVGHLANQLGDSFRVARVDRAAEEGRNELSGIIAQGPRGPDGNWSPEQLAVMIRRAPELGEKFYQQAHEMKTTKLTEEGLYKRNDATIGGQNSRSAAEIAGREKVVGIEQANANQRNDANIGSAQTINKANITSASELQSGRFGQEAHMARLNAAIDEAKQEKLYAQQNGLRDKETAADEKMARLRAELTTTENKRAEEHQATVLDKKFANDEKLQRLTAELNAAESAKARAFQNKDHIAQREADERILRIRADLDLGKSAIQQAHEKALQTQAEGARAALPQSDLGKVGHDVGQGKITPEVGAAGTAQLTAPTPASVKALDDLKAKYIETADAAGNIARLEGLLKDGVDRGPLEPLRTFESTSTGGALHSATGGALGSDKARAERTTEYNRILNLMSTAEMSRALTGATTNFELQHFVKIYNDPKSSDRDRSDALTNLMAKVNAYKASHGEGIKSLRGDVSAIDAELGKRVARTPDAPAAAAAVPRPEGKDDAALKAEAAAVLASPGLKPEQAAAIKKQLQDWGVK